jgi:hypothetical protein
LFGPLEIPFFPSGFSRPESLLIAPGQIPCVDLIGNPHQRREEEKSDNQEDGHARLLYRNVSRESRPSLLLMASRKRRRTRAFKRRIEECLTGKAQ